MNPVPSRRSRRTLLVIASIGLVVIPTACTPNEGPSAPTVAPTLAAAPRAPATLARGDRTSTTT